MQLCDVPLNDKDVSSSLSKTLSSLLLILYTSPSPSLPHLSSPLLSPPVHHCSSQLLHLPTSSIPTHTHLVPLSFITFSSFHRLIHQLPTQIEHIVGWVRNSFTSLAMVDYPYAANFLAPLPAYPITVSCQILLNSSNRLVGLAQAAGKTYISD